MDLQIKLKESIPLRDCVFDPSVLRTFLRCTESFETLLNNGWNIPLRNIVFKIDNDVIVIDSFYVTISKEYRPSMAMYLGEDDVGAIIDMNRIETINQVSTSIHDFFNTITEVDGHFTEDEKKLLLDFSQ